MEQFRPTNLKSTNNKITPYRTRTGIEIGKFYEPKQIQEFSRDMELLQESLLTDAEVMRRDKIKSIAYVWFIVVVLFFLVVAK
jgi:hypothetical protein